MMKLPRHIRESNPLFQIYDPPTSLVAEEPVTIRLQAVVLKLLSALPKNIDSNNLTTIFKFHQGHLYASQIWEGMGNDSDTNAAAALHDAITRDSGCPGLTHLARAIYGLTLCARWGGGIGSIDQQLYQNLQSLVEASNPDATFWAAYVGAVAAALAWLVPAMPKGNGGIDDLVR